MKELLIRVTIDEFTGKMGTAIKTVGFDKEKISDQLELMGLIENLKSKFVFLDEKQRMNFKNGQKDL